MKTKLLAVIALAFAGLTASAATFNVGYNTASPSDFSTGSGLPASTDYNYSYCQAIYTPQELNGLYSVEADGTVTADITSLTFKFTDTSGDYISGQLMGMVYIQNYDGVTFPLDNGDPQWVDYDETVGEMFETETFEMLELYDEDIEITVDFKTPLRYEGKSILVTFITTGPLEGLSNGGEIALSEYTITTTEYQSAVSAGSNEEDHLTGELKNAAKRVPAIQLGYNPVTLVSDEKPVLFGEVTPSLYKVEINPEITGWNHAEKANAVSVAFTLENAEADGTYEIQVGNTSCGTITGTSGVINFLGNPTGDVILTVVPQEGQGGSYTINKEDINALFTTPEVIAGDAHAYCEYKVYDKQNKMMVTKATVQAAASFLFDTDVPVAKMKGTPGVNTVKVLSRPDQSWDIPECFHSYLPATTDYNDYETCGGVISYYQSNFTEANINHGKFVAPSKGQISVKFSAEYPLLVLDAPRVGTENVAKVETKGDFKLESVVVDYDNKSGYSYNQNVCSADIDYSEGNLTLKVEYPDALLGEVDEATNTIYFFAPEGHVIHYAVVKASAPENGPKKAPAEVEWVSTDSNTYEHDMTQEENQGHLHVKTMAVNPDSGEPEDADYLDYEIDDSGKTLTGIDNVAADNNGSARFYNLQGVEVKNPAQGVYIMKTGNKAVKVLVK